METPGREPRACLAKKGQTHAERCGLTDLHGKSATLRMLPREELEYRRMQEVQQERDGGHHRDDHHRLRDDLFEHRHLDHRLRLLSVYRVESTGEAVNGP
jgi:hypothetical protein